MSSSLAHEPSGLRPTKSKQPGALYPLRVGSYEGLKVNNPVLAGKLSQLRDKHNASPRTTPTGSRGDVTFSARNNFRDTPTPPLTPIDPRESPRAPSFVSRASSCVPEAHAVSETTPLSSRTLHPANLHLLQSLLYRLVAGMRESWAPLLDKAHFLSELVAASTRQELTRLLRQFSTRLSKPALKAEFWDSHKERLEDLSADPHFDAYVAFLHDVYHGCSDHAVHMERWWLEVDAYPFEHALRLTVDQRQLRTSDDDVGADGPLKGQTSDDDEGGDLTGGVSMEGIEALFEQKRREYSVLDVFVEEGPAAAEENGGEGKRRASAGGEARARRASRAEKAEGQQMPTNPDEAVLFYRFLIQRGDGHRLSVARRYSDVFALMTRLEGPLPCALSPFFAPTFRTRQGRDFPGKTLHRRHDSASAEHRRALFKTYLHAVLRAQDVHMSEPLCTFLDYTPLHGYPFRTPRCHDWPSALLLCPYPTTPPHTPTLSLRSHESAPSGYHARLASYHESLTHPSAPYLIPVTHTHSRHHSRSSHGSASSIYSTSAVCGSYSSRHGPGFSSSAIGGSAFSASAFSGSAGLASAALSAHLGESSEPWLYKDE